MIVNGLPLLPPGDDPATLSEAARTRRLYQSAREYASASVQTVKGGGLPDVGRGEALVGSLLEALGAGPELLLLASDRGQRFRLASHCANVAILALHLARVMDLDRMARERVGLAGLLHEVGVVRLPGQLLHQSWDLKAEERRQIRQLPAHAAEILGRLPDHPWLLQIVAQVHEREDGTGFPFGLSGTRIREEAQVLGISDTFEAFLHPRPYRPARTGFQAIRELTVGGSTPFSRRVMKGLLKAFSLYPYNEIVLLNNGYLARVVDVNQNNPSRPRVKLLRREGASADRERLIDLAVDTSLHITRAVTHQEWKELGAAP